MKTEWITQQQYDDAWQKVNRTTVSPPDQPIGIQLCFPDFDKSSSGVVTPKYRRVILQFQRNLLSQQWELVTPIQVVEIWLAQAMQTWPK